MFGFSEYSEEGRPWFQLGKVPVTTTVLLVGVFSLSMVVVSLVGAAGYDLNWMLVSSHARSGAVWQLVTWPMYNVPSIWFAMAMVFLFLFGREVERVLGRVGLLKFTAWLAAALTLVTVALPRAELAGASMLGFGIFLAFAMMHPEAPTFFGLTMKWVALILVGIYALQFLYLGHWSGLAHLAVTCVASAFILKSMAGSFVTWLRIPAVKLPALRFRKPSGRSRAASPDRGSRGSESGKTRPGAGPREFVSPEPEIDRLLDKVASQGLESLSPAERRQLAEASDRYQRRK